MLFFGYLKSVEPIAKGFQRVLTLLNMGSYLTYDRDVLMLATNHKGC